MDPIAMLKKDHQAVKKLFARFEKLGERASSTKRELARRIVAELELHAFIEEQVLYPAVRQWVPDMEDSVLEAYEEHHVVERTCRELGSMGPEDEMFDAKISVLGEAVKHHIEEEEGEILPALKKALGKEELSALGQRLQVVKRDRTRGARHVA